MSGITRSEFQCLTGIYRWGKAVHIICVDYLRGDVVGNVCVDFINGKEHSFVAGLLVAEEYRRQGYGTRLLQKAEEVSRNCGRNLIQLEIEPDTEDSEWVRKWYADRGYHYAYEWDSEYGKYEGLEKKIERN